MERADGRRNDELRSLKLHRGFIGSAAGSCLIECGRTRIICTATVSEVVPSWMAGQGRGWVTAEYSMLPGSTNRRKPREGRRGNSVDGRTVEIQRLVGRAFRPAVNLASLGERTIHLDCDVIEADGGTRTTAINGAAVALHDAVESLIRSGAVKDDPIRLEVAAVSVGVVDGQTLLDLSYAEDSLAEADINVVMTSAGEFIEVQGTGEKCPFSRERLGEILDLAEAGIREILAIRRSVLSNKTSSVERPQP